MARKRLSQDYINWTLKGKVHALILTYFGISMAFCSTLFGISQHYSTELEKFKAEIMRMTAMHNEVKSNLMVPSVVSVT